MIGRVRVPSPRKFAVRLPKRFTRTLPETIVELPEPTDPRTPREILQSFFEADALTGHWHWMGGRTAEGTPYLWIDGHAYRAVRVAWDLDHALALGERSLRRLCDCQDCIAPAHHEIVARLEGMGRRNPNARLTEEDVIDIRDRAAKGAIQDHLAREYHVSQAQISNIVKRKAWRHVD